MFQAEEGSFRGPVQSEGVACMCEMHAGQDFSLLLSLLLTRLSLSLTPYLCSEEKEDII